jgi:hypothetical protein
VSVREKAQIIRELERGEINVSVCKKLNIVYSFDFVEEQRANLTGFREEHL